MFLNRHIVLLKKLVIAWLFLSLLISNVSASSKVESPEAGVALWHYFQGENVQALTELMKAELKLKETQESAKNAEENAKAKLMRAGIELAYGMTQSAENTFTEILQNEASVVTSDVASDVTEATAWFYLAKLQYQQSKIDLAYLSIGNTKGLLDPDSDLAKEVDILKANILIADNQLEDVADWYSTYKFENEGLPLVLFNLGNAYIREGNYQSGLIYFDKSLKLLKQQAPSQDGFALRDKIYTATGFVALLQDQPLSAMGYFENVQQQGLDTELAMLGYGRAASDLGLYSRSTGYLTTLGASQQPQSAVFESWVSLPVTYERRGKPAKALALYQKAIDSYSRELNSLDGLANRIKRQDTTLFTLIDGSSSWFKSSDKPVAEPMNPYFLELFAENAFQSRFREFQELSALNELGAQGIERLDALEESLLLKAQNLQIQSQQIYESDLSEVVENFKQELDFKQNQFERNITSKEYLALVHDSSQQDLYQRVSDSKQRLKNLKTSGESLDKEMKLLKFYEGILLWQAAQDYSANKQIHKNWLDDTAEELEALVATQTRIDSLIKSQVENKNHQQKIQRLRADSIAAQDALDKKIAALTGILFTEMLAEIGVRKKELNSYRTEARLASLRIYEKNSLALAPEQPFQAGAVQ